MIGYTEGASSVLRDRVGKVTSGVLVSISVTLFLDDMLVLQTSATPRLDNVLAHRQQFR